MSKTKLLLIGSSSLVGSHFVETFADKYEISTIGRRNIFEGTSSLASFETVDIQNESRLKEAVRNSKAEFVINYAAETNVDGCEVESGNTSGHVYLTNTVAVRWIAQACKDSGKVFYQISTDFVFDGSSGPYSEEDKAGPVSTGIGWYGYTKYLAEKEIIETSPDNNCIIRISYPYRAKFDFKTDFARNILDLYKKGKLFPLFVDQLISPTLIDDVSRALDSLIHQNKRGIYHVSCKTPTTPFDFGYHLVSVFFSSDEAEKNLKKGSIIEFNKIPGKAKRPVHGGLKMDKIQNEGFTAKTYQQGIDAILKQMCNSSGKI